MSKLFLYIVIAVGLMVGGISTFAQEDVGVNDTDVNPSIGEIIDNPDKYVGKTVTVSGEVEEVYGPQEFKIVEEGLVFSDELPVVITKSFLDILKGDEEYVAKDDVVQVTGEVRKFVGSDIEEEADLDLDPRLEGEVSEGDPVIIATKVQKMAQER